MTGDQKTRLCMRPRLLDIKAITETNSKWFLGPVVNSRKNCTISINTITYDISNWKYIFRKNHNYNVDVQSCEKNIYS